MTMRAVAVYRDHRGVYTPIPAAEPEDFAGILATALSVERVDSLTGWCPYTAAWRVVFGRNDAGSDIVVWYHVDEEDPPLAVDAVAALCGVQATAIHMRRHRGTMIEPAGWVSDSPWWHRADVLWAERGSRRSVQTTTLVKENRP